MDSSSSMEATPTAPQSTEPTPTPTPTPPTVPPQSSIPPTPEIQPPPSSNPSPNSNPNPSPNPSSIVTQPSPTSIQQQQQQHPTSIQQQQQQLPPPLPPPPQTSSLQPSQIRAAPATRIRPQQSYSHFPSSTPLPSSSLSPASPSIPSSPMQRGGVAIGVPAHQSRPPPSPNASSFSTFGPSVSYNQQYGGLGRSSVNVPDSIGLSSNQVKPSMAGLQSIGMIGSLSSGSQMRPTMVSSHIQQRSVQPSMRSQSPSNNQSLPTQKYTGPGLLKYSSIGNAASPSPGTPLGLQTHTQPWMSSAPPGKQMHPPSSPSPSYRQQTKPQSFQQKSHHPQHQHPSPTAVNQQIPPAQQQQQPSQQLSQQPSQQPQPSQSHSHQTQDHFGQQYPPSRVAQTMTHQPQVTRGSGSGNQKSPILVQSGPYNSIASGDIGESSNQILSKRSIHELITQIDPSEKFDPEVEEILAEIADDFVESITTFSCSLAKHRKSTMLEAKDILLHLERNWNMSLPGFGGDEIKNYKKPFTNDIHRERLAAIKKSMVGSDAANTKSSVGQAAGNAKGHAAKLPAIGSPKAREVP